MGSTAIRVMSGVMACWYMKYGHLVEDHSMLSEHTKCVGQLCGVLCIHEIYVCLFYCAVNWLHIVSIIKFYCIVHTWTPIVVRFVSCTLCVNIRMYASCLHCAQVHIYNYVCTCLHALYTCACIVICKYVSGCIVQYI